MYILLWQDWATIISLLLSFISLFITFKTYNNTKNISEQVNAAKIKEIYPDLHTRFKNELLVSEISLNEGDKRYCVVFNLLKTCREIQHYYDNWDIKDKKTIDKFTKELDGLPVDIEINDTTRIKIQKDLLIINSMLERIGDLNGIR